MALRRVFLVSIALVCAACANERVIEDPLVTLRTTGISQRDQVKSMQLLDGDPTDEAYLDALKRVVWYPGYTVDVREAAVERLIEHDLAGLKRTLRQQLPRMTAWQGLTRLCEIIAAEGWVELTPALVSSWARPVGHITDERERPEYKTLAHLYGAEHVTDEVFKLLLESRKVAQQGLRTRCWALLHRLGERERLAQLLRSTDVPATDTFLMDLKAGAETFDLVPNNREEILWLRELRTPERRAFWDEAAVAVERLSPARRATLEVRDLPIVVAAARHAPDLLTRDADDLYAELAADLKGQRHYVRGGVYDQRGSARERLHEWRGDLRWADLATMLIAVRAMSVPQVADHLFDYAGRDRADETTEYGGVLAIDSKGRFEVLEYPPRLRENDQKFIASQAMLDAAYTSLFHFHFHVQRPHNSEYAGPGFGDLTYAENTRANCLVLTSIGEDGMNVDYYRHSRVLIDLGVLQKPATRGAAVNP